MLHFLKYIYTIDVVQIYPMDPQPQNTQADSPVSTIPVTSENVKYGGAWSRFWAYFVDGVLSGFFVFLFFDYIIFVKGESVSLDQMLTNYSWLGWSYLVAFILYLVYFTYTKGATIGKNAYGLKVVQYSNHTSLSLPQAVLREASRNILMIIPIAGGFFYLINALMILFSKEKRGIHDRISQTQVLKVKNPWPIAKQILLVLVLLALLVPPLVADTFITSKQRSLPREENTQQATQPTSNEPITEWETFTSIKYKYSITYPKKWTIFKGKDIDATDKEKSISMADYNVENCCWIVVEILDQKWSETEATHPWISSPSPTTLAGASGIEGEESLKDEKSPKITKYIYLKHPSLLETVVSIRVHGNNIELLNTVLNSLKFN